LAILGMFLLVVTGTDNQLLLTLFILGSKYGICQLYNMLYVGTTYLFPIEFVATSFGICNIWARFFSIFSPYVAELKPEELSQWVFIAIFSCSMVVSFLLQDPKRAI
jgi:hypothetical protein